MEESKKKKKKEEDAVESRETGKRSKRIQEPGAGLSRKTRAQRGKKRHEGEEG